MATLLMSAVRQSARKNSSTITTSTQPMSSAWFRFDSDISMNVAGRKIVGIDLQVAERGLQRLERLLRRRASPASVLAPSCFSTISSRPGTSLMMASPIGA